MKRWWRFLAVLFLGVVLSLRFSQSLQAEIVPSQLVKQAQQSYQIGEFAQSIKLLKQAHRIYQSQEKYLQQVQTLSLISQAQQQIGNWELANQNIAAGFALADRLSASNSKNQILAQIWHTKGHYEFATGKSDASLEDWQQAEELYRNTGDRLGVAGSLLARSQALEKMGFHRRSCNLVLEAFGHQDYDCEDLTPLQVKAIITQVETEAQPWQIAGLNKISNSLLWKGKLSQAKRFVQASQKISSSRHDLSPLTKAKVILNLGNINKAIAFQAQETEDLPSFTHHSQKAAKYYQQLNNYFPYPQIARQYQLPAQLNLLSLYAATAQWFEAQKIANQIELYADTSADKRNLYGEIKFAQNLVKLKQNEIAIKYTWQGIADIYLDAAKEAQKIGDRRVQSYGLGYLGTLYAQQPNLKLDRTPQQLIEQALNLAQQIHASEIAYRWQWQLGKIYAEKSNRELAIASYQASLASLASLRHDLASLTKEVQFNFHEQIEPIYKECADLLLQGSKSDRDLATAIDVIEALQIAELDNYFQDACITSETRNINQIDKRAAAIYTLVLPDRLEVIMAMDDPDVNNSHQAFYHHSTSIAQENLVEVVTQLRRYITEPDRTTEVQQLSAQLYDILIEPFEADLSRQKPKNLVFILDSILQTVPMSVLYDGEQYLLEKQAIAIAPGLRMLNLQNSEAKASFLAGGITQALQVQEQKFSALNSVEQELNLFPEIKDKVLLNDSFTADNLLQQINDTSASYIHLATHGQFSSNPNKTFLLMWQKLLTIKDFGDILHRRNQRVSVPIELLVLSACDTASGDRYGALGLAGVAVRSGALSTIATLWQVNDESTAMLMKNFYQYLKQDRSKAEALRLAQLKLWQTSDKDWQVPAFWSAYVIIGNWQ